MYIRINEGFTCKLQHGKHCIIAWAALYYSSREAALVPEDLDILLKERVCIAHRR